MSNLPLLGLCPGYMVRSPGDAGVVCPGALSPRCDGFRYSDSVRLGCGSKEASPPFSGQYTFTRRDGLGP